MSTSSTAPELHEGVVFAGRYRIARRLASGAMGAVYEVVHLGTHRRHALKVMHPHILARPELRERFKLEARVTAGVVSEFLVEVFDSGIDEPSGTPFLVMEFLEGEDLGQRLKRLRRLAPEEALLYLHQAALALDETHSASIVHRDLKPGNLFLCERGGREPAVKVLDFGVAKIIAESATAEGGTMAVGTPFYMAPEQFRGGRVSAATDVYALGMMTYTLLVGTPYWADDKAEHQNLIAFALTASAGPRELATVRASRRGTTLPAAFDGWFARVTAVQPASRFGRATEAVAALAEVLGMALPAVVPEAHRRDPGTHPSSPARPLPEHGADWTMRDYLDGPAIPVGLKLRWLASLARLLAVAHRARRVHGRLTPEGVLIRVNGSLRVPGLEVPGGAVDTVVVRDDGTLTGTGAGDAFTPYLAPEQLEGRAADARTDQYGWGVLAYELLSGDLPWSGGDTTAPLARSLAVIPRPLREGVRELPEAVAHAVLRALEKRPEDRHPSLDDAAEALEPFTTSATHPQAPPNPYAATEPLHTEPTRDAGTTSVVATDTNRAAGLTDTDTVPPVSPVGMQRSVAPAPAPAPPAAPRLGRARAAVSAGAIAVVALAAFAPASRSLDPGVPVPAASPLQGPSTVLACPIFAVSGIEEPAGWLGAAAAATLCERARVILGGRASRTLVPAELLDLPALPIDRFPADPYAGAETRQRSLAAARRRAAAYVDGEVRREPSGFRVALSLHRSDGGELARAEGVGRALYQAVREAMTPLVRPELVPRAGALDPVFSTWSRARDVDGALALLDVVLANGQNAGGIDDECTRLAEMGDRTGEVGMALRWLCAYVVGVPPPVTPPLAVDPADPAAFVTRLRVNYLSNPTEDAPRGSAELHPLFERESSALGHSLIAATESCLVQSYDPKRAAELAFMAVQADPKNPLGELCTPWGQLVTVTRDTASADSTAHAMQAWMPWHHFGWSVQTLDGIDALAYARRAYLLAPFNTNVADALADLLLARGAREEVRNIALGLAAGSHPLHHLDSDLLLLRVDASEARFTAALARARRAMESAEGDAGWVRGLRFEAAWQAVELGGIVGRAAEIADRVVERFLDPEPAPLDGKHLAVSARIPAICALASKAAGRRCFARFRALRGQLSDGILPEADAFALGAERYASDDLAGAARAWRPLMRQHGTLTSVLPEAFARAFERSGDLELVALLDAAATAGAERFNGATPAMVGAARRAARRGDRETARTLARRVIEAWSVADETVPAVEEMRRLLAGLR